MSDDVLHSPAISVCVPVYNTENYLDECITSILSQTFSDFELICVDDGSTDNSYRMLLKYILQDSRVIIISTINNGQAKSRNLMLQKAKGKYVYFVDSDDYLQKDALKRMFTMAEQDGLDILRVCLAPFTVDGNFAARVKYAKNYYKLHGTYDKIYSGIELIPLLVKNKDYCPSTVCHFIKREFIIENNIFFSDIAKYEDNEFNYKLLILAKRIIVSHFQIYRRRYRENSLMTQTKCYKDVIAILNCYTSMISFARKENISIYNNSELFYPLVHIKNVAVKIFNTLNEKEKKKVMQGNISDKIMYYSDFLPLTSRNIQKKRHSIFKKFVKYILKCARLCARL